MHIEISDSELQTRQSNGRVLLCRSCKDNRKKNVLMRYGQHEPPGIEYGFCEKCLKLMGECVPCLSKKKR